MKLRHPGLIRLAALGVAALIRLWVGTLRIRGRFEDGMVHPRDPGRQRCIYAFWHESLLIPTVVRTPVHILISLHADGELITQACRCLGVGVVRGSTTRQGTQAVLRMLARGQRTHLAITPDGPRGPRRRVQLGTALLASLSGMPVVPLGVGFSWAWRAKSWDQFALPLPFSTVYCVVGRPIAVPSSLDRAGLERWREWIESEMLRATRSAEEWAEKDKVRPSRQDALTVVDRAA